MILEKSLVEIVWNVVLKKELEKLVKRTTSPVDDRILEIASKVFEEWLSGSLTAKAKPK
jgi:hypothetical protein